MPRTARGPSAENQPEVLSVRIPAPEAPPGDDAYDRLLADLWEAGTLGITEGDGFLDAFFADEAAARRFGDPRTEPERDWIGESEAAWPPIEVGERFFIAPPWSSAPTPPGRLRLTVTPGMQCGTGYHACTQLCLEAMERLVRPGCSVLDVGSGSGILSLAAGLLGAGRIVACDIDPEAAPAERLGELAPPFFVGSVDAVRPGSFDVVVANISEIVLGPMRAELERAAPVRILSGFQDEAGEWSCVVC